MGTRIEASADVSPDAEIGAGSQVWHLAQIREGATLGEGCIIGRGAYIGTGVTLGVNCKVQNYALVYEPASLADGVFVGPAVVFTNDQYPRAVNPDGSLKSASEWQAVGVTVDTGAAIGARAVCVAPVRIGAWSTVAAGAVVTRDVAPHALVAGVPARRIGWVGHAGARLQERDGRLHCPVTGQVYEEFEGSIREVTT
jgi:acetyltransferase-like isoleucine patch superfamily enzyme